MAPAPDSNDPPIPPDCRPLPPQQMSECVSQHFAEYRSSLSEATASGTQGLQQAKTTGTGGGSTSTGGSSPQSTSGPYTPAAALSGSYWSSYTTSPPSAATNSGDGQQWGPYSGVDGSHHNGMPFYVPVGAVLVPIFFIAIVAFAIIRTIKRRRRQRRARDAAPEMKELNPNRPREENAYVQQLSPEPPLMTPPTTASSLPPTNRQPEPVILSSTMDQAYFTGLDTADRASIAPASSSSSNPFAHEDDGGGDGGDEDEPPPPYRPRSVPPISRETSVRTAPRSSYAFPSRNSSQHTYRGDPLVADGLNGPIRRSQDMQGTRSPFDDPAEEGDDDTVSEVSTIRGPSRGEADRLSVVSDLSYQEDAPVVGRSPV